MKTVTVNNIKFDAERFKGWSKAKFESIYQGHIKEAGKVFDLIKKLNDAEVIQPINENSEPESNGTTEKSSKRQRSKKADTGLK